MAIKEPHAESLLWLGESSSVYVTVSDGASDEVVVWGRYAGGYPTSTRCPVRYEGAPTSEGRRSSRMVSSNSATSPEACTASRASSLSAADGCGRPWPVPC